MTTEDNHVPVDRGWAWVILTGCTILYFVFIGTLRSFGLFFVEYLDAFGASASMASLISGVQTATYSVFSWPVMTVGLQFLSVRQSVMIGACLCSHSYGLNSLVTSIKYLVVTQSVIFGAGTAFMYSTAQILLGKYFDKRRGLANGLAFAGCSLGGLVFPPLYGYILQTYGLHGGMIVTSGILLNLFIAAALLRPPSFYQRKHKETKSSEKYNTENSRYLNKERTNDKINKNFTENRKFYKNTKILKDQSHSNEKVLTPLISNNNTNERITLSQPILNSNTPIMNGKEVLRQKRSRTCSENIRPNFKNSVDNILDKLSNSNLVRYLSNGELTSQSFLNLGSIDITPQPFINKEDVTSASGVCSKLKILFYFDTSLLKSLPYILHLVAYCFAAIAGGVGYIFTPPFAVDQGIPVQQTAILISVFGTADLIGRILSGWLADRKIIKKQYISAISIGVVSLIMQVARFCTNMWTFVIFSAIHGMFAGMCISLNPTIMIDIIGVDRFANGMAVHSVIYGFAQGVTAPFLGFLRDHTGTYYMTFHYMGIACFVGMIFYAIVPCFMENNLRKNDCKDVTIET